MQNTIQNETTLDPDALLAVSLVLMDVSRTLVAVFLRYVEIGLSITNLMVDWAAPMAAEKI